MRHGDHGEFDETEATDSVTAQLRTRFPDTDEAALHDVAEKHVHEFADAPVKDYVDNLAGKKAREDLAGR